MQNKLLPCPFCGGEAEISEEKFIKGRFVYCTQCHIQTKLYITENTSKQAINDWNTRKPMEWIVEQLESQYKYNSEQSDIYRNVENPNAYTREMKDVYMERANCYGMAIRTVKGGVDNG